MNAAKTKDGSITTFWPFWPQCRCLHWLVTAAAGVQRGGCARYRRWGRNGGLWDLSTVTEIPGIICGGICKHCWFFRHENIVTYKKMQNSMNDKGNFQYISIAWFVFPFAAVRKCTNTPDRFEHKSHIHNMPSTNRNTQYLTNTF